MLQGFYVGVDVASRSHVAFSEQRGFTELANTKAAIARFLAGLPEGATLALESTGGYGLLLAEMACEAGLTVHVLPPGRVRHFCRSSPSRGKTDRIDARDIAAYARAFEGRLRPYCPLPPFERRLRTLVRKKEAIADKLASLRSMLRSLGDTASQVRATLAGLEARKRSLEAEISHEGDAHIRRAVYLAGLSGASSKLWGPYYRRLLEDKRLKPVQAVNALGRKILHTVYGVYAPQTPFNPNLLRLDMKA